MKAIWLTVMGVCVAGVSSAAIHPPKDTCLLGSDCLGRSKTPFTACQVIGKAAKAKSACNIDGMKLLGKLDI